MDFEKLISRNMSKELDDYHTDKVTVSKSNFLQDFLRENGDDNLNAEIGYNLQAFTYILLKNLQSKRMESAQLSIFIILIRVYLM